MNKKNVLKIILDFCMVIVLALMYSKRAVNMEFHEIGGLILLGVFLIHILINYKWVTAITKKMFSKSIPVKTKLGYILNILLLISFALVGISGIFISKVVFHISSNNTINWKTIHYSSAAFALLLIGIHIGFHYKFITSMLRKMLPIPHKAGTVIGILLSIIILAYGGYSLTTTSFTRWLIMPFSSQQIDSKGHNGMGPGGPGGTRPDNNSTQASQDISVNDSNNVSDNTADNSKSTATGSTSNNTSGITSSVTKTGAPDSANGMKRPEGMEQSSGLGSALKTLIDYFSIAYVFAAITALIEILIKKTKKKEAK